MRQNREILKKKKKKKKRPRLENLKNDFDSFSQNSIQAILLLAI